MDYSQIPYPEEIPWIKVWTNPNNKFRVLAIHYSADPSKNPATKEWKIWYDEERKGMPKAKWNKEYEIDFSSKSGQLVFGSEYCDFNPAIHFIDSKSVKWELLFSLDFGQSNPNAWLVWVYDKTWTLYIVDEYYKPAIPSVATREMFLQFCWYMGKTEDEIRKLNHDQKRDLFRDTFQIAVIDPTTRSKNRVKVSWWEETQFSVIEDFYDNWMELEPWNNDWDASITRLREYMQLDWEQKSHIYIFADKCPKLCWELARYKYKEQTEWQSRTNNNSERPVKKNDHGIDSLRYMIMTRPNKPMEKVKEKTWANKDMERFLKPKIGLEEEWLND